MSIIVRIPEPCHEDWNKMIPDEKGRFCNVCTKSVHDFSTKTDLEIYNIINENKEANICGHFRASQLNRPLQLKVPFNMLPKNVSRLNAFAIALFFVFGTFLFSCSSNTGQIIKEIGIENNNDKNTVGEMSLPGTLIAEIPDSNTVVEEVICTETIVNGGIERNEDFVEGSFNIEENKEPEILIVEPIIEPMIAGGISYHMEKTEPVTEIKDTLIEDSVNIRATKNLATTDLMKVFPNPSNGEFNISYEVKQKCIVRIDLFDMNGSHIRNILKEQPVHTGNYILPVVVNDLANGIYFCKIIMAGRAQYEEIVITK